MASFQTVVLRPLIALLGAAMGAAMPASSASSPDPASLEVGTDGLPERVLDLNLTATALIARLDPSAFLYEIWATPRTTTSGNSTASVVYSYYLPARRTLMAVTFADIALAPQLVEAMKRAGQWDAARKSMEATRTPTTSELTDRNQGPIPYPLPVVKLDLRDAYVFAKRAGLRSLDHALLTV